MPGTDAGTPGAGPGAPTSAYCPETVRRRVAFLRESEWWPAAAHRAHQLERLRDLLAHAGAHVPYYRRLFGELGLAPDDVRTLDDLRRLPCLTKEAVKRQHADFVAGDADPATLTYLTTGGSTGDPLKVVMDRTFQGLNHANTVYYMGIFGFEPGGSPSVRLHGNTIPAALVERGEYWVEEGRRLTMSGYHIAAGTCRAYVDRINAHRPRYVHAFASAIALLCEYADRQGLALTDTIECVFCDSETLYPWQRRLVERVLRCPVHDIYGHTEGAVLAMSCPRSPLLHVAPQVGVLELLAPDGAPVTGDGQSGEIVVTGFNNRVFPLVRYRTGDIGTLATAPCPCGRQYPLLRRVEGRIQDHVVGRAGAPVLIAPALFDYRFDWSGVDRFQVHQDTPGVLTFRVVAAAGAAESPGALAARIATGFDRILGGEFEIRVQFVDAIARTGRGKYRYVDQRLPGHAR
jgi:phenylacetate-CoA ligase